MTTEILAPTICPECTGPIEEFTDAKSKITTHWCTNKQCVGRLRDLLTYVADRTVLEIDGLGPELAAKLVADDFVTNLADLFEFQNDARSAIRAVGATKATAEFERRGFPVANTYKMIDSLETAKTASWDRWIAAFGIPMIGRRLGKVLAKALALQPDDLEYLHQKLATLPSLNIEGFGPSKLAEISDVVNDEQFRDVCARLHAAGVRPTATATAVIGATPLAGTVFVITGEFDEFGTREYITAKLESLGAVAKTGVTKKVNKLLVGTMPGKSKLEKATTLGIEQFGDAWLSEVFETNEIERTGGGFDADLV